MPPLQTKNQGTMAGRAKGVCAMHFPLSAVGGIFALALLAGFPAGVAHGATHGGGMNTGPYNSSAMAVMRERQEKIRKCAALPNFDSDSMTYAGRSGRRVKCP
jgi:hypothetical protein